MNKWVLWVGALVMAGCGVIVGTEGNVEMMELWVAVGLGLMWMGTAEMMDSEAKG